VARQGEWGARSNDWGRYDESLRDGGEVWIDSEQVDEVIVHTAFKDMIGELARVYDLRDSGQYSDEMTCIDPQGPG